MNEKSLGHEIEVDVAIRDHPRYFSKQEPWFSSRIPHAVLERLLGEPKRTKDGEFWWLCVNGQDISVERVKKEDPEEEEKVIVHADARHVAYDYFGMVVYSSFGNVSVRKW